MLGHFFYDSSEHPCFQKPSDGQHVWRYMSLAKLVSLLHASTLHFSRADHLGDPFEGSWARIQPGREDPLIPDPELEKARRKEMWQMGRESAAINCWYMSDHESAAMWSQYGNSGIAVRTTFNRLVHSFPVRDLGLKRAHRIYVGRVQYVDYETCSIPEGNAYWPFMHKRMSFAHEQELRAIVYILGEGFRTYARTGGVPEAGIDIPVNLPTLVERVYVAPGAGGWFAEAVRAVLSRFGMAVNVVHSDLDAEPIV